MPDFLHGHNVNRACEGGMPWPWLLAFAVPTLLEQWVVGCRLLPAAALAMVLHLPRPGRQRAPPPSCGVLRSVRGGRMAPPFQGVQRSLLVFGFLGPVLRSFVQGHAFCCLLPVVVMGLL
ncbi:hypothetical protein NDU88_002725 [Pleurodeles waltl]|uniref:Uncharacterized protein n=1 Tax=Pleurodeles waltl TaxID=8319 RepID=A0AAV7M6W0_PLEWA|nr:hypothetical protein NDU88_002725 [Pleurodeles waltl]